MTDEGTILAIDPGNEQSGWVLYDLEEAKPIQWHIEENEDLRQRIKLYDFELLPTRAVIEYTPPYALQMQGGRSYVPNQVVLTAFEAGRMAELIQVEWELLSRTDVKKWLLGRATGNDAAIRDAIYDRYGGTRKVAVGTKKKPGPLHGIIADCMAALAVALAWHDRAKVQELHDAPF